MEVKRDYGTIKLIPANWEIRKLGEVAYITKLAGFEYTNYFNSYKDGGDIIVIRGTNITKNKLDLSDVRAIPSSTSNKLPRSKLNKDDLVFAYVGTIGPVYLVKEDDKFHLGPNTSKISAGDLINPHFLFYYFTSWLILNEIIEYTSVGAQPSLSMSKIRKFKIILPTLPEQTAIANSLSDVDTSISSMEKLITKKRNIKQGAMQLLLTGKKRLPGFSGDWETKTLKKIVSQFIVPMRDKPKEFKGNIPWCRIEDFDGKYLSDSKSNQYVDQEIINLMNLKIHPIETLLVSCSADLGRCAIVKAPLVSNQTFIGLRFDEHVADKEFFYYYMTFYSKQLNNLSSGTTISYLSREQFENFKVLIPPTKIEQTAMAQVLSDMDTELEALEQKVVKYRLIKQGMMQELLTGKKRLI